MPKGHFPKSCERNTDNFHRFISVWYTTTTVSKYEVQFVFIINENYKIQGLHFMTSFPKYEDAVPDLNHRVLYFLESPTS